MTSTNNHVDFYLGTDPATMVWLGSVENKTVLLPNFNIWWENNGISPFILFPRTVHTYIAQVDDRVVWNDKSINRKTGWKWDYASSAGSAWTVTCDAQGKVFVSHYGSAWVDVQSLYSKETDVEKRTLQRSLDGLFSAKQERALPDIKNAHVSANSITPFMNPVHTITLTCSKSAVKVLATLLRTLETMGSNGSSREVKIDDYGSVFFDGDGRDRINSIVVNGVPLKDWMETYLREGRLYYPSKDSHQGSAETAGPDHA